MALQDSSLKSLRDDELVNLTMDAISAGPLTGEHGELIEPETEQARVANAILDAAVQELLRRAGGRPIAIHLPDGRELRADWKRMDAVSD